MGNYSLNSFALYPRPSPILLDLSIWVILQYTWCYFSIHHFCLTISSSGCGIVSWLSRTIWRRFRFEIFDYLRAKLEYRFDQIYEVVHCKFRMIFYNFRNPTFIFLFLCQRSYFRFFELWIWLFPLNFLPFSLSFPCSRHPSHTSSAHSHSLVHAHRW